AREPSAPLTARAEHNAIPLSAVAPTNQSARLSRIAQILVKRGPVNVSLARELYYGAGATLLKTLPTIGFQLPLQESVQTTRTIVLKGVNARLAVGDYVLTVEGEHTPNEDPTLYQISALSVDKAGNTTSITWQETAGAIYRQTTDNPVTLYVLRAHASPFASAAPNWYTLSPTLTATQPSSGLAVGKASSSGTG